MNRLPIDIGAALAATLLAACSSLPPHVEQDAEQYVGYYESWSGIAAAHADDCQAMGDALYEFAIANGAQLKAVEARLTELPPEQLAEFHERYDPRIDAAEADIEPLFRCIDHPRVKQALSEI